MKRATALRYSADEDEAPVIVSQGEGDLARRIESMARELGVAVVRDVPLVESLAALPVGEAIPEGLYESVAAILTEVAFGSTSPGDPPGGRPHDLSPPAFGVRS